MLRRSFLAGLAAASVIAGTPAAAQVAVRELDLDRVQDRWEPIGEDRVDDDALDLDDLADVATVLAGQCVSWDS